jgi:hypothetical protein
MADDDDFDDGESGEAQDAREPLQKDKGSPL